MSGAGPISINYINAAGDDVDVSGGGSFEMGYCGCCDGGGGDISTLYTNTLFVSKAGGDNDTAERENINKPWGDIWAAKRAAQPGDLIYVRDGRWTVGVDVSFPTNNADSTTILKDSITYFFAPSTGINVDGNERIFYDTSGVNTTILGYMIFNGPNTNANCMYAQAENSNVYIEFDSLNLGNGAGFNTFAYFKKFKSWNVNINNFNTDRSETFYFGAGATDTILSGELSINIENYRTVSDVSFAFFGALGGYWENVNVSLNVKNANVDFEYYEIDINDINTTWVNCNLSVHFDKCLISSINHTNSGQFFRLSGGPFGPGSEGNQIKISGNYQLNNAVGFGLLSEINFDGAGDSLTYVIENLTCYSERNAFKLASRGGSVTENVILKNVRVGCKKERALVLSNNVNSQYYIQDCFFYTESDTNVVTINTNRVTIANSTFIRNINSPLTGGNVFAATAPYTVRTAGVYSNESVADADITFIAITQHPDPLPEQCLSRATVTSLSISPGLTAKKVTGLTSALEVSTSITDTTIVWQCDTAYVKIQYSGTVFLDNPVLGTYLFSISAFNNSSEMGETNAEAQISQDAAEDWYIPISGQTIRQLIPGDEISIQYTGTAGSAAELRNLNITLEKI